VRVDQAAPFASDYFLGEDVVEQGALARTARADRVQMPKAIVVRDPKRLGAGWTIANTKK
jgi:hypothetical protein